MDCSQESGCNSAHVKGGGGEGGDGGGVVDRKNEKVWFKLHSKTKKTLIFDIFGQEVKMMKSDWS
jgi:hypothetical protein